MIPVPGLKGLNISPGKFKVIVAMNAAHREARGNGNKSRRRRGLPVPDSTRKYPYAMSAGEFAAWFREGRR